MKQFKILQKKGFKLFSNWQDLNDKSIYVLGTKNENNFDLYIKKALKKIVNIFFVMNNLKIDLIVLISIFFTIRMPSI